MTENKEMAKKQEDAVTEKRDAMEEYAEDDFIGYIKLLSGNSSEVASGEQKPGEFITSEGTKLSQPLDAVFIGYTHQIMKFKDSSLELTMNLNPEKYRPEESPDFLELYKESKTNNKCTYGFNILMYLPDYNMYKTFFFKNTSKKAGIQFKNAGRAKLGTKRKEGKNGVYFIVTVTPSNDPYELGAEATKQMNKLYNLCTEPSSEEGSNAGDDLEN